MFIFAGSTAGGAPPSIPSVFRTGGLYFGPCLFYQAPPLVVPLRQFLVCERAAYTFHWLLVVSDMRLTKG